MTSPFDPFLDVVDLPSPDETARQAVSDRARSVLRPTGALARLDEIAVWLAGWQRTAAPAVEKPAAVLFAADHGVTAEGVSAYPSEVTRSMVDALEAGVATASVMAVSLGVRLSVVDVGVGEPTGNLALEPAMGERRFEEAFRRGADAVARIDCDLLVLGEMGIGNTTAAAAVSAGLYGGSAEAWVGPGTGLDDAGVARKAAVVDRALSRAGVTSPLEILRQLGGAELAAMAGACLQARLRSIPTLIDGYVATAAVMPLEETRAGSLDHCWPSHLSPEPGHRRLVARLGREPLLDLGLRLGEGSGALAAVPLARLAADVVVKVATFEEWGLG